MLADQARWDARYQPLLNRLADGGESALAGIHVEGGDSPSPCLRDACLGAAALPLERGKALDLASGPGRNALFLAEQGFDVTAVDVSPVALEVLTRRAQARGLPIVTAHADLDRWILPADTYSLVVCSLFLERSLFDRIPSSLKQGGWVYYESLLSDAELAGGAGGTASFRLSPGELLTAFLSRGFRVYHYAEGPVGDKASARILARRLS